MRHFEHLTALRERDEARAALATARHDTLMAAAAMLVDHDGGPERLDVYDGHDAARWLREEAARQPSMAPCDCPKWFPSGDHLGTCRRGAR